MRRTKTENTQGLLHSLLSVWEWDPVISTMQKDRGVVSKMPQFPKVENFPHPTAYA